MRTILFIALICAISQQGFSQDCKKLTPIILAHSVLDGKPGFKAGFEAGYIGQASKFGYTAGFQFEFHEAGKPGGEDVANASGEMFKMFVKGTYRVYRKENRRMIYLTLSPELNMNSVFDLKSGVRFLFPVSPKFGFGVEPVTSLMNGNLSASFQLFCRL